jgi:hypothetical protein
MSDHLVTLLMKADGVDPGELETMLRHVADSRSAEAGVLPSFMNRLRQRNGGRLS